MKSMKFNTSAVLLALVCTLGLSSMPVQAKGCIKGAVVGAVAGHYAGGHAVAGAVGGCLVGRHLAKKKDQAKDPSEPVPSGNKP